jgi:phage terminase small subunit
MAGRPRKPKHQKEAQGTLRKGRELEACLEYKPVKAIPPIPDILNEDGRMLFTARCREMIDQGLLTSVYIADVIIAACFWQLIMDAQRHINKDGTTVQVNKRYFQTNCYVKQLVDASKGYREIASRYGWDLVSSQRIQIPDSSFDEFDK